MATSAGSPITLHLSQPAKVAELADAPDLGSGGVTHESSSLSFRTNFVLAKRGPSMAQIPQQPEVKLTSTKDYRDSYANSVQVRVNVWDFFLVFGTLKQQTPAEVEVENFQGVYLSPQQAKALLAILGQNVAQYEQAFGEIKLDPKMAAVGPIH